MENEKKMEVPSRDLVREWVKKDLHAANYALALLLRYPDIVEKMADEIYERLLIEEQDRNTGELEFKSGL